MLKRSKHTRVEGHDSMNPEPEAEMLEHARRQRLFAVQKKLLDVVFYLETTAFIVLA